MFGFFILENIFQQPTNPFSTHNVFVFEYKNYRGTKLSANNISAALSAHGYQGIPAAANVPVTYSQQHHQKYQQPQQQQQQQQQQQPHYPPQPKVSSSFEITYFI